jgi:ADP-dependent phosphofructokinase/glucokinase
MKIWGSKVTKVKEHGIDGKKMKGFIRIDLADGRYMTTNDDKIIKKIRKAKLKIEKLLSGQNINVAVEFPDGHTENMIASTIKQLKCKVAELLGVDSDEVAIVREYNNKIVEDSSVFPLPKEKPKTYVDYCNPDKDEKTFRVIPKPQWGMA